MDKIRAEPGERRLDGFMEWSRETIEANKKIGHGITDKKETCSDNSDTLKKTSALIVTRIKKRHTMIYKKRQ